MKIVVIEDHKLFRGMLTMTFGQLMRKATVDGASSGEEGVELCRELKPDIVFLDLDLPDDHGLKLVPRINAASPASRIIVLTSHADEFTLHRVRHANVQGFLDKAEQPIEVLQEAVATVMAGQQYYSSVAQRLKAKLQADPAAFDKVLSEREQELLCLFGQDMTNEQVAKRTGLSASTVKSHRRNIMNKLNLHTASQLVRYALEKGFTWLEPPPQL